jgi:chemotaxis protein CheD
MRRITDRYPGHNKIRLGIGEGGLYTRPTIITTVLGSCVSVTFFCRTKNIGGIFHAILPSISAKEKRNPVIQHYKYVDSSIENIMRSFYRRGIEAKDIEAKLFGGAEGAFKGLIKPGANNIIKAYETLAHHNIKIKASDIGGEKGRNLIFVSDTGEVFIKNHGEFVKNVDMIDHFNRQSANL